MNAVDIIFNNARTQNGWTDKPVTDEQIKAIYDIAKMGSTSMNCQPARFQFLRTSEGKAKLAACASPGNQAKIIAAPVVAIIGMNPEFYKELDKNFSHNPNARAIFEGNQGLIDGTTFRNSTLQGAYLMVAAKLQGLDCGAMSGFVPAKVDEAFWAGTTVKTNFICCLGYGDPSKVMGRLPRYSFDEACTLA
jgi:3-hydroxypropanoate dehydrogenase